MSKRSQRARSTPPFMVRELLAWKKALMVDSSERVASLGPNKKWGNGNPQANDTTGHTEALNQPHPPSSFKYRRAERSHHRRLDRSSAARQP